MGVPWKGVTWRGCLKGTSGLQIYCLKSFGQCSLLGMVPFGYRPFWAWSLLGKVPFGYGPFWGLVPFSWSLLAGPLWVGSFWLPTLKKCIFSQITLKFLILSASAHTGFDHQSAKIPAKTCSMFPGHAHRTVLQNQKEYCNFKNF